MNSLQLVLEDKLMSHVPMTGNTMQKWDLFKTLVRETAESTPGLKKRAQLTGSMLMMRAS